MCVPLDSFLDSKVVCAHPRWQCHTTFAIEFNESQKEFMMIFIPIMMGFVPIFLNFIMHYTYSGVATMTPEDGVAAEMREALEYISPELVKYQESCIAQDVRIEDLKSLRFEQLRALGVRSRTFEA